MDFRHLISFMITPLVADGHTNAQIARRLGMSEGPLTLLLLCVGCGVSQLALEDLPGGSLR